MKDLVTIGLPSKGRLKESSLNFLEKNNLRLTSREEIEIILQILIIYQMPKLFICTLGKS